VEEIGRNSVSPSMIPMRSAASRGCDSIPAF
jgi:hypothetical protein